MNGDRLLATLAEHRSAVLAALADAPPLLDEPSAGGIRALTVLRWEVSQILASYQAFKHAELFDPLLAGGNTETAALARAMKERCLLLGRSFDDHVRRWSSAAMAADWAMYRVETLGFVERLRSHLAREEAEGERLLGGGPD